MPVDFGLHHIILDLNEAESAKDISERIVEAYTNAAFDSVYIIYNECLIRYPSPSCVEKILPVDRGATQGAKAADRLSVYEQAAHTNIRSNVAAYIGYRRSLSPCSNSAAAEHCATKWPNDTATITLARMDELLRSPERIRRGAITREIIEGCLAG